MKNTLLLIVGMVFALFLGAQNGRNISDFNWLNFEENSTSIPSDFWKTHQEKMNLGGPYSFVESEQSDDELGMAHYRFDQYFEGYKIEGAQYLLHYKNNLLQSANGRPVSGIKGPSIVNLSFLQALDVAKNHINTTSFYWESEEMEKLIKYIKEDNNATFYPKNELVYVDENFSQDGANYKLAYKIDLYYEGEHDHSTLFIDAKNGELLLELEQCHTASANGTAKTRYHGTVDIVTDKQSNGTYVLKDATRGSGIETYNIKNGTRTSSAVNFVDMDNYWDNANAQMDEAAGDTHWATEKTYDYYKSEHNRNSYNDRGGKIVSYVHYSTNYFNASWNGSFARYGDGNGNPLTTIDIIGHELSHGVTGNSARLVYRNESGALNESFSDIFGTAIEHKYYPTGKNWKMGTANFQLRDMANPSQYSDPSTYLGGFWHTAASDNGGVHTNSGVQNYWFYLLADGGTGVNDNQDKYAVNSIGIDKAAKIAYRNLTRYLTSSSTYLDARNGSVQAAKDLYGNCSSEAQETTAAWHAVGIGTPVLTDDVQLNEVVSPKGGCTLGNQEVITIKYKYEGTGCNTSIPVGDTLSFYYQVNGASTVSEKMIVSKAINTGDELTYSFKQKADLSVEKVYDFDFYLNYKGDKLATNDSSLTVSVKNQKLVGDKDELTFESPKAATEEILYSTIVSSNSKAYKYGLAAKDGNYGIAMTGKDFDISKHQYNVYEDDNFKTQPEYISKLCACVDASNWGNMDVEFDIRQTYSGMHSQIRFLDRPIVMSSMRLTVDGVQVGDQYHPNTNDNDPWKNERVNLVDHVGKEFTLCFEGKHFVNLEKETSTTYGDNTFLDNIKFIFSASTNVDEQLSAPSTSAFSLFPNPTNGDFELKVNADQDNSYQLLIKNVQGQNILSQVVDVSKGENSFQLSLEDQPSGLYLMSIFSESGVQHIKIVRD